MGFAIRFNVLILSYWIMFYVIRRIWNPLSITLTSGKKSRCLGKRSVQKLGSVDQYRLGNSGEREVIIILSSADRASGVRKYFKLYVTWDQTIVSGKRELICNHKQIFEHKFGSAVRTERMFCCCYDSL